MPRRKDENGKIYAWSDDGFAVYFQLNQAMASVMELSSGLSLFSEYNSLTDHRLNLNLNHKTPNYQINDFRGADSDNARILLENGSSVRDWYDEEGVSKGKDLLRRISGVWENEAKKIPVTGKKGADPKLQKYRRYLEDMAFLASPDEGNNLRAIACTPYLEKLLSLRAYGPIFSQKGANWVIKEFNKAKTKDGKTQPDAYDAYMDLLHSSVDELRLAYKRQKISDEASEKQYLSELKDVHKRTVDAFNRLWEIRDDGQFDNILSNKFNDVTGKKSSGINRNCAKDVGHIRGEIQAIENGWSPEDLSVLGAVGAIEAEIARHRSCDADDQDQQKHLDKLAGELQTLKSEVWDKKIRQPKDKVDAAEAVNNFLLDHIYDPIVSEACGLNLENYMRAFEAARNSKRIYEQAPSVKEIDSLLLIEKNNAKNSILEDQNELLIKPKSKQTLQVTQETKKFADALYWVSVGASGTWRDSSYYKEFRESARQLYALQSEILSESKEKGFRPAAANKRYLKALQDVQEKAAAYVDYKMEALNKSKKAPNAKDREKLRLMARILGIEKCREKGLEPTGLAAVQFEEFSKLSGQPVKEKHNDRIL